MLLVRRLRHPARSASASAPGCMLHPDAAARCAQNESLGFVLALACLPLVAPLVWRSGQSGWPSHSLILAPISIRLSAAPFYSQNFLGTIGGNIFYRTAV